MIKLNRKQEKAFTNYLLGQWFIEEGSGRIVYEFRDMFVVKVAKNKNGYHQNKNEIERYQKYGGEKLAHIIAYSKKIIVMEKLRLNDIEIDKDKRDEMCAWLDKICGCDSTDHYDSLGFRKNGDLVYYDYGDSTKTYDKQNKLDMYIRDYVANEGEKIINGETEL